MSSDGTKDGGDNPAPNKIIADLEALLVEAASSKEKFDQFIASAISEVTQVMEAAKASGIEAEKAKSGATDARGVVETVQAAIEQVVDKAKVSLSEVDALKTDVATAKGAIEENRKSANADLGVITQSKTDIEALKSAADALSEKVSRDYQNVSAAIEELKVQQQSLQDVLKDVLNIKASAEEGRAASRRMPKRSPPQKQHSSR